MAVRRCDSLSASNGVAHSTSSDVAGSSGNPKQVTGGVVINNNRRCSSTWCSSPSVVTATDADVTRFALAQATLSTRMHAMVDRLRATTPTVSAKARSKDEVTRKRYTPLMMLIKMSGVRMRACARRSTSHWRRCRPTWV